MAEQAELEYRLAQLAGLDDGIEPLGGFAGDDSDRWAAYRRFAQQLERFYAALPETINERLASSDVPTQRGAGRLLRLLRPRDAERIQGNYRAATCAFPKVRSKRGIVITAEPDGDVKLVSGQPAEWGLNVQARGFTPERAEYRIAFDPEAVELRCRDTDKPVAPNEPVAFPLRSGHAQLPFVVTARKDVAPGTEGSHTEVAVRVEAGAPDVVERGHRATMVLPPPDRIDLVVHRIDHEGTTAVEPSAGWGASRLRPFLNRPTRFHFYLVNRSHRRREVEVELLAPPRQWGGGELTESAVLDESGRVRPGVKRLAGPVVVELPGDEGQVPVDFSPPEEAPDSEAAEAGAGAEDAGEPEAADITAGLVCVVRRLDGERSDGYVFRFAPVVPADYIEPRVRFDGTDRLEIRVAARPGSPLPPLTPERPIRIRWMWDRPADAPEGGYEAAIVQPQSVGVLHARVPRDADSVEEIPVEIDGYPRAFVYRVRCDRARDHVEPLINLQRVRIDSPAPNTAYSVPLAEPIRLKFAVDAPRDAFLDAGDLVSVRILEQHADRPACHEQKPDFFSARQERVELRHAGDGLEVFAAVGDFDVPLKSGGLINTRVRLAVDLTCGGRAVARGDVPVTLDGASPVLRAVAAPTRVEQGHPIEVRMEAEDLGGIQSMELGFEGEQPGEFAPTPKRIEMTLVAGDRTSGRWSAWLPSTEVPTGEHRLLIRAVDRAGNPPTDWKGALVVRPPPDPPPDDPPKPKTGTIEVRVSDGRGAPLSGARVRIHELGREGVSDGRGACTFRDVPHGAYTVGGRTPKGGRFLEGRATAELSPDRDLATVRLQLD